MKLQDTESLLNFEDQPLTAIFKPKYYTIDNSNNNEELHALALSLMSKDENSSSKKSKSNKDKGKEKIEEVEEPQAPLVKNEDEFDQETILAQKLSKELFEATSISSDQSEGTSSSTAIEIISEPDVEPNKNTASLNLEAVKNIVIEQGIFTRGHKKFVQDIFEQKFTSKILVKAVMETMYFKIMPPEYREKMIKLSYPNFNLIQLNKVILATEEKAKIIQNHSCEALINYIFEQLLEIGDTTYYDDIEQLNIDNIERYFALDNNRSEFDLINELGSIFSKYKDLEDLRDLKGKCKIFSVFEPISPELLTGLKQLLIKDDILITNEAAKYFFKDIFKLEDIKPNLNEEIAASIKANNDAIKAYIISEIKKIIDESVIKFGIFTLGHKLFIEDIYNDKFSSIELVEFLKNIFIDQNMPNKKLCAIDLRLKYMTGNWQSIIDNDIKDLLTYDMFIENLSAINNLSKYFVKTSDSVISLADKVSAFHEILNMDVNGNSEIIALIEEINEAINENPLTQRQQQEYLTNLRKLLLEKNIFVTNDIIKYFFKENELINAKKAFINDEDLHLEEVKDDEQENKSITHLNDEQMLEYALKLSGQDPSIAITQSYPASYNEQKILIEKNTKQFGIVSEGHKRFYQDVNDGKFTSLTYVILIEKYFHYKYVSIEQLNEVLFKYYQPTQEQVNQTLDDFKKGKLITLKILPENMFNEICDKLSRNKDFSYYNDIYSIDAKTLEEYFEPTIEELNQSVYKSVKKFIETGGHENDIFELVKLVGQIKDISLNKEQIADLAQKVVKIFLSKNIYLSIDDLNHLIDSLEFLELELSKNENGTEVIPNEDLMLATALEMSLSGQESKSPHDDSLQQ